MNKSKRIPMRPVLPCKPLAPSAVIVNYEQVCQISFPCGTYFSRQEFIDLIDVAMTKYPGWQSGEIKIGTEFIDSSATKMVFNKEKSNPYYPAQLKRYQELVAQSQKSLAEFEVWTAINEEKGRKSEIRKLKARLKELEGK